MCKAPAAARGKIFVDRFGKQPVKSDLAKTLLILLFAFSAATLAFSGSNLVEKIQIPPAQSPKEKPELRSLLTNSRGEPVTTRKQWLRQREVLDNDWQRCLGEFPKRRAPLKTEYLSREELPGYTRELVRYQIEEGVWTDGYLLTPKANQKRFPALVVFHPTTPLQAKGVAGLAPEYDEEKRQGVQLVQRGYVVWCPRNFIFDETPDPSDAARLWNANVAKLKTRHPGWRGMARMTFDAIRAADFLESLPNVDQRRIGCIGHSLGGKVALYAAAFDSRYRAAVSSEGGIGLGFSNWEAPWYLGPEIREPDFRLENHQVLSLIAPRAFLLLAGDSADGDKSWAFIEAALPVYKLFGAEANLGWFNHHQGHRYSPEARQIAEAFLDEHLKK